MNFSGLCAINHELVLTLDNVTLPFRLGEKETLAVADCSGSTSFAIQLKLEHEIIVSNLSSMDFQLEIMLNACEFPMKILNYFIDAASSKRVQVRGDGQKV